MPRPMRYWFTRLVVRRRMRCAALQGLAETSDTMNANRQAIADEERACRGLRPLPEGVWFDA